MKTLSNTVIAAAVVLYFADRIISILVSLRSTSKDTMSRAETERELARLEAQQAKIADIHQRLFDKIDELGNSVNIALADVSRSIGKLEGSTEVAKSIQDVIKNCAAGQNHPHR